MEMFDVKDSFNKKIDELEIELKKFKAINEEKITEVNQLTEKNVYIANLQKKTESDLKSITENFRNIENELNKKIICWKSAKEKFNDIIKQNKTFINNNFPIKEINENDIFSNPLKGIKILLQKNFNNNINKLNNDIKEYEEKTNFNILNRDYLFKSFEKYGLQLKHFSSLMNNVNSGLISNLDIFLEGLKEHINFLHSNVELKTEHRGYLYPLDKLKMHLFCIQQIIRSISFFIKILNRKIESLLSNFDKTNNNNSLKNFDNDLIHVYTNLNILIFLFNKSVTYTDLLGRYFSIMIREERKIVNIDADNDFFSNRTRINKNLKNSCNRFLQSLKLMTKNLNILFNFDLNYHLKSFKITSDNSAMIIINVNQDYFKRITYPNIANSIEGIHMLNKIFTQEFQKNFKIELSELITNFELKLELEYKMFEIIKEENRLKYNYPIINLSSLRLNNDNLKNSLKELSLFFSQDLFTQVIQIFKINSWEFSCTTNKRNSNNLIDGDILMSIFSNRTINFIVNNMLQQKSLIKSYLSSEPGIDYEEAIRDKNILREMLEKENNSARDKENYHIKLGEYEEDLKKFKEKVLLQENELDVYKLKLMKPREEIKSSIDDELIDNYENKSRNNKIENGIQDCSLKELIENGINLVDLPKEILSDDVHSGKQRSSFKLTDKDNKAIPLTNFKIKSDNINEDLNVIYHRKILDKVQKYTAKIKNIDIKVMANIQSQDIKREYDEKLSQFKKENTTEIDDLNEQIKSLKISHAGYTENIDFLTNVMVDYESLKEYVINCKNCAKYIRPIGGNK
jgi:hypothetical protein